MFVKNNFEEGYVNGTLGVVEDFAEGLPVVRTRSGKRIFVSEAEWEWKKTAKCSDLWNSCRSGSRGLSPYTKAKE